MALSKVTVLLTSGSQWRVPEDCNSIQVECLSNKGVINDIRQGSTGSSYSRTNSLSVTPGGLLYYALNFYENGGYGTWVNNTSYAKPSTTTQGCYAYGSHAIQYPSENETTFPFYNGDFPYGENPLLGDTFQGVGDIRFTGGMPGDDYTPSGGFAPNYIGGNGGSAGPNGAGGRGGDATSSTAGAGGAANGGENASGTTAGQPRAGATGGAGGAPNTSGTVETLGTDFKGTSYGVSGGSGGKAWPPPLITTPNFGGGGSSDSGVIIITYTRRKPTAANTITRVIKGPVTSEQYLILPAGTTRVTIEGVGGGSAGFTALSPGTSTSRFHGGGGGSYANTVNTTIFPTGSFIAYAVANSPSHNIGGTNTYATIGYTGEPTSPTSSSFSISAKTAFGRFSVKTSIGQRVANGGDGGLGYSGPNSATVRRGGGGGGAAFWFDGGAGGGTFNPTATPSFAGGGGGGAATGASPGTAGSAGFTTASPGTTGGAGGNAGTGGGSGGAGGTSGAAAGNGTNGGGGGGAFTGQGQLRAGDGAMYNVAAWYIDTYAGIVGPVGPGGGGGGANNTGQGGVSLGYGGGGGGGREGIGVFSLGNTGVLIITYTFDPNAAQVATPYTFGYIID